jgi:xylose isomerase
MKVPMMTTNLFTHPVFKDGGFTSNDRQVRRYALRKVMRNMDLAAELGAETYVLWGGREGSETDAAKDVRAALERYREGLDLIAQYSSTAATGCASPSSPSRTSRAATSCCRPSATRWASSPPSSTPSWSGLNPEVGHEQMSNLNFVHGIAQALWQGKLFHIDLNGQHGPKFDQDLVFGSADVQSAFFLVDLLESAGYDGPRHFDYKPLRTEDADDVWVTAAANMRNYLILRDKARAFRADPEVQAAMRASRCDELAQPTLAPGETYRDLAGDDFDVDTVGRRGYSYSTLDQLAMEHLLGVRS